MVRDLLSEFVPKDIAAVLDLDSLELMDSSFTDERLTARESDVVWRARFAERDVFIYILLELQSGVDRFMALRMMNYTSLLWRELIRAKVIRHRDPLPWVLPIVLDSGDPSGTKQNAAAFCPSGW